MICNSDYFCARQPDLDLEGYEAATAHCDPPIDEVPEDTYLLGNCDGPEDGAIGEYCVAMRDRLLNIQCTPDPSPAPIDCRCLACWDEGSGLRSCTLCRTDEDCGPGQICGEAEVGLWNNDVRGCRLPD